MPGIVYVVEQMDSVKVGKDLYGGREQDPMQKIRSVLVDSPRIFEARLLAELMKIAVPANDGKTFKMSFAIASEVFDKVCKDY